MNALATTKLSSKGQVVIPENIRAQLGLRNGDQFIVIAENDVVILKMISQPEMKKFTSLVKRARKQAKAAGLKKSEGFALGITVEIIEKGFSG